MDVVLAGEEEHYGNGANNLREFAKGAEQLAPSQSVFNDLLQTQESGALAAPRVPTTSFALPMAASETLPRPWSIVTWSK